MFQDTFIKTLIADVLSKHQTIDKLVFILPSKRAGVFLLHELKKQIAKTTFAPKIISIEEFICELSGLQSADNAQLLFEFYRVYSDLTPPGSQDSFEAFSTWAQILLQDFNEIDRYLVPPYEILNYLSEIKDLEHWSLKPEKSEMVKNYLIFWSRLYTYYDNYAKSLLEQKKAYQGLIYREAANQVSGYAKMTKHHHIFAGFNALNNAEQTIFQELLTENKASVYWDTDSTFMNDDIHAASIFLRNYKKSWHYYQSNSFNWEFDTFAGTKNIQIKGIPKNIGQAKYVGHLLSKLVDNDASLQKTAVILGDEQLLIPILNAVPATIQNMNITMGFPLHAAPIATIFELLFNLHSKEQEQLYYQDIIHIVSHPNIRQLLSLNESDQSQRIIDHLQKNNIIFSSLTQLTDLVTSETKLTIQLLFDGWKNSPKNAIHQLQQLILLLKRQTQESPHTDNLLLEYLYRFHQLFNQLQQLNETYQYLKSTKGLHKIYKELLSIETLDFQGEPLEGLQLMGVLESRVLDFETVIITNVNEGVFPSGKTQNSFLPFELKLQYKLPTYQEKDAIYTYHFYKQLQRAKNIYLLYNTEADALNAGEKSRFINQLEIERQPEHTITHELINANVPKIDNALQSIDKNKDVLNRLKEIAAKGFSPSALTSYIRNPIDFFNKKILRIQTYDEVEETVAANTLGTIVHETLKEFYLPLINVILTETHITTMQQQIDKTVTRYFKKEYQSDTINEGMNLIIFNIAKRYVENFLRSELEEVKNGSTIKILHIEEDFSAPVTIEGFDFPINVHGQVDRVDEYNGTMRIIDYKTGKVLPGKVRLYDWDLINTDYDKYSKSFQVLCYAYMLHYKKPFTGKAEAGIISFKNQKDGFLKFGVKPTPRSTKADTEITPEVLSEFSIQLKALIKELFDLSKPFVEKRIEYDY
ncbi:PD-(D/E)XK nuclease family protein [Spongiivirga citrea]|uniref:PD-(D/E)XK nuclease family protein n=1 Tax=Spongiivirga citrea TaxID=1481457 RepID=A0A6M0CH77_9FLAO|nr:PD-(D/E)XK nuclease family protein [Spongiivirga citrea]NER17221.1 PD-(D/E)XK nuclease family protein [Spongiivirga citrea]